MRKMSSAAQKAEAAFAYNVAREWCFAGEEM
jgi:hypothetical protein